MSPAEGTCTVSQNAPSGLIVSVVRFRVHHPVLTCSIYSWYRVRSPKYNRDWSDSYFPHQLSNLRHVLKHLSILHARSIDHGLRDLSVRPQNVRAVNRHVCVVSVVIDRLHKWIIFICDITNEALSIDEQNAEGKFGVSLPRMFLSIKWLYARKQYVSNQYIRSAYDKHATLRNFRLYTRVMTTHEAPTQVLAMTSHTKGE